MLQAEHNLVRPYSYTHSSVVQNYGHYNQELAHPLGANFRETLFILKYGFKRVYLESRMVFARYGEDTEESYFGRDIFRSYQERPYEHGHSIGQGVSSTLLYSELRFSYLVNPKNNLHLQAGVANRQLQRQGSQGQQTLIVFAGIRTGLFNWYYDR